MNKVLLLMTLMFFMSCGESGSQSSEQQAPKVDKTALKSSLDALEADLTNNKSTRIDKKKANELIDKSIQYVDAFPEDELSAPYLFRAAEVCVGIGSYQKALDTWDRVKAEYANHEKTPIALFLQGFTCENQLQDRVKAKEYYTAFLAKYPQHEYVDQVQMLLSNIDKSPEDLIKSFQEKRKKENQ